MLGLATSDAIIYDQYFYNWTLSLDNIVYHVSWWYYNGIIMEDIITIFLGKHVFRNTCLSLQNQSNCKLYSKKDIAT